MQSPAMQALQNNAQKILSPQFKGDNTFVIHESGLVHLSEEIGRTEQENADLREQNEALKYQLANSEYEKKRLRDSLANQVEFNSQLIEETRKLKAEKQTFLYGLPFNLFFCEHRFEKKQDCIDPRWIEVLCHAMNGEKCDARNYELYPRIKVTCPRVLQWLEEKGE